MVQQRTPASCPYLESVGREPATGNWQRVLICCPQMRGACRWTARFLLLVMIAPAYAPLAMACAFQPAPTRCCRRKSLSAGSAQTAMPCHHARAEASPEPKDESSEPSVAANNNDCCQNHCCCGATTSERAQPTSRLLQISSLLIERARLSYPAEPPSADISGHDSARAPPPS